MTKITTVVSLLRTSAIPSILTALVAISAVVSTPASAAKFGVRVIDESGRSVAGVAVCAGISGNSAQFGSLLTDESGLAMLDVPPTPFVLTVSKFQQGGLTLNEPARGFNLIKQLTLKRDATGPTCHVVGLVKSGSLVSISDVQISDNAYTTTLQPQVQGRPTEYRVSRTASFNGIKWERFDTSIPLSASLSAEAEVYIQMRRYAGLNKSWIEAKSNVVNVKLPSFE